MYFTGSYFTASYFAPSYFTQSVETGAIGTLLGPFYSDRIVKVIDCGSVFGFSGCAVINNGQSTPTMKEAVSQGNAQIFWMNWEDKKNRDDELTSSAWVLPVNFEITHAAENVTVVDSGSNGYPTSNAARILVGAGVDDGAYSIGNRVTFTREDGITETSTRWFKVTVKAVI